MKRKVKLNHLYKHNHHHRHKHKRINNSRMLPLLIAIIILIMTMEVTITMTIVNLNNSSNSSIVAMGILIRPVLTTFNQQRNKTKRRKRSKRVSLTIPQMKTMNPVMMMRAISL